MAQAKQKLVVIGNGMAGVRAAEELLLKAPNAYDITIIGAEPHVNYNRIMLSPVLAGEVGFEDIVLNDLDWYKTNHIQLVTGVRVTSIDRDMKQVIASDSQVFCYDKLLLATGSNPFILPIPGAELNGVIAYRDIADTEAMMQAASEGGNAVVIGGGLLGLEAANGLAKRGMKVTVVHLHSWLMERQLDQRAASLLQANLESRGISFELGKNTQALGSDEKGNVSKVILADGAVLAANLVVMAIGIRPNAQLAEAAGLECGRGITVNDQMQSVSDPNVYCVGECAEHRGIAYGLVAPLYEQAKVVGENLAAELAGHAPAAAYHGSLISTKLKVTGVELFSAGNFSGGDGHEEAVLYDPCNLIYKKLVFQNDVLVGACIYGDTSDASDYLKLIQTGERVSHLRHGLMFGYSFLAEQEEAVA